MRCSQHGQKSRNRHKITLLRGKLFLILPWKRCNGRMSISGKELFVCRLLIYCMTSKLQDLASSGCSVHTHSYIWARTFMANDGILLRSRWLLLKKFKYLTIAHEKRQKFVSAAALFQCIGRPLFYTCTIIV